MNRGCQVYWGDESIGFPQCKDTVTTVMKDSDGFTFRVCDRHRDYALAVKSKNIWVVYRELEKNICPPPDNCPICGMKMVVQVSWASAYSYPPRCCINSQCPSVKVVYTHSIAVEL